MLVTHIPVTGSALVLTSVGRSSTREFCLMLSSVSWAYSMQSERTVSNKPGMAGGEEEERGRREEGEVRREEGGNRKTGRGREGEKKEGEEGGREGGRDGGGEREGRRWKEEMNIRLAVNHI